MAYIHLYKGAVTAGGTDGTQVSEGDNSNPLSIGTLNVTVGEESEPVKIALRCDNGYETRNTTTISLTGTTADKWVLAPDNNGVPGTFSSYGESISTTDTINATNWIFWIKSKAEVNENPTDDTSVKIHIEASIASTSYTG